jgi:hypothetical protein
MVGLLCVMGDFHDIQTLALVSRCSKKAHTTLIPLVNRKMGNKEERRKLWVRLFPGATFYYTKDNAEAGYYIELLNRYFVTCSVPQQAKVTHLVGIMLDGYQDHTIDSEYVVRKVKKAMKSAQGRRRILVAVEEWSAVLKQNSDTQGTLEKSRLLERLISSVHYDFCCKGGKIHTFFYNKQY